tara:strand:- start:2303 stop:2548 length:246 start_codon:yes stop_codon:yes gene_type:complete
MGKFVGIYNEKSKEKTYVNTDKIISFNVYKSNNDYPYVLSITYGVDGGAEGDVSASMSFSFKEEKTANDVVTNILLKHGDL